LGESLVHRTGRPAGFKPFHIVVAVVVGIVWFGVAAFVLTHGRGDQSSVDVYSELPADFTGQLLAQGVQYQGLSSIDAATQQTVLSRAGANGVVAGDSSALVFRTAFTDKATSGGKRYTDQPALMVVVPDAQTSGRSATSVFVEFVDPSSYQVLKTLTYQGATASPSG
jgi:hypothetical protein